MRSRPSDKVQIEHMRLAAGTQRFQLAVDFGKAAVKYAAIFGCAWVIMRGLVDLGAMDKGALGALAGVVKALRMHDWFVYIAGGGGYFAWALERQRNKRGVRRIDELRRQIEAKDPDRLSSGLDKFGNTPKS